MSNAPKNISCQIGLKKKDQAVNKTFLEEKDCKPRLSIDCSHLRLDSEQGECCSLILQASYKNFIQSELAVEGLVPVGTNLEALR